MRTSEHLRADKVYLIGEVGAKMVEDLHKQAKDFEQRSKDPDKKKRVPWPKSLHVVLSTTGGSVVYGKALFDILRMLNRRTKLSLVVEGTSMSMGASVMMAVPWERRFISRNGNIMIHEVRREFPGLPKAPASVHLQWLKEAIKDVERMQLMNEWTIKTIARGSGNSVDQVREWYDGGMDFDTKEAVDYGFVSAIMRG